MTKRAADPHIYEAGTGTKFLLDITEISSVIHLQVLK